MKAKELLVLGCAIMMLVGVGSEPAAGRGLTPRERAAAKAYGRCNGEKSLLLAHRRGSPASLGVTATDLCRKYLAAYEDAVQRDLGASLAAELATSARQYAARADAKLIARIRAKK